MGAITNQMRQQARTTDTPAGAVIFGGGGALGSEGKLNGADKLSITVDGSGTALSGVAATTVDTILTILVKTDPSGQFVPNTTTVTLAAGGMERIELTDIDAYEIELTGENANSEQVVVSSRAERT